MKKLIIFTLALSLILTAAVSASQTRVETMGDNHVVLTDDANIWNWASRLNNYPGLAIGEFGSSSFYPANSTFSRFGVHWQFGDDDPWVLATYFENNFNFYSYWGIPFGTLSQNRRGTFFYARNMGTNKFGARLSYTQSGFEYTDNTPDQEKEAFHYIEGHAALTANDDSWDVGLTFGFGSWEDTDDDTTVTEPDGLIDVAVLGRMFWNSGPNYTYVPHVGIEYHKVGANFMFTSTGGGVTRGELDYMIDLTNLTLDLGIGQIYTPSSGVEAVLDIGIRLERNKEEATDVDTSSFVSYEDKWSFTTIPYFKLGLDAEVFSWMDVRLGATTYWNRYKNEYDEGVFSSEFKQNYADNDTYLGFGFHWGNLHVDTYTDPQLFLEGFNFISGGSQNMNFRISAVYELM